MEQEVPVALLLSLMEATGIACDEAVLKQHKDTLQVGFRDSGLALSIY